MRIAVVDDEDSIRELLRFNLQKAGYDVIEASDGAEAVRLITNELPDLVLLDIMLPAMDGFEVCRQLKADSAASRIPVIMLTARDEEIDKVLGLELGADDYIAKPFSVRELMARIKAVLRRSTAKPRENELTLGGLVMISAMLLAATASRQGKERPEATDVSPDD